MTRSIRTAPPFFCECIIYVLKADAMPASYSLPYPTLPSACLASLLPILFENNQVPVMQGWLHPTHCFQPLTIMSHLYPAFRFRRIDPQTFLSSQGLFVG